MAKKEHYVGIHAGKYHDMSCHCFALGADVATAKNMNARYAEIGAALLGNKSKGADKILKVTPKEIEAASKAAGGLDYAPVLKLLCKEFDIKYENPLHQAIRIWGLFRLGQFLPEHMWLTFQGKIYDTMPGASIRRDVDRNGVNPPSENDPLDPDECHSIVIRVLTPTQKQVIITPDSDWEEGM